MLTERQFDEYLSLRRFEPSSHDLAERILACAQPRKVKAESGIAAYFQDFMTTILQPKHAFSVLAVLVIGVMIGITLPVQVQDMPKEFALIEEDGLL